MLVKKLKEVCGYEKEELASGRKGKKRERL
jgi:hypothetical protein